MCVGSRARTRRPWPRGSRARTGSSIRGPARSAPATCGRTCSTSSSAPPGSAWASTGTTSWCGERGAMRILELLSSPVWTGPAEPMASVAGYLRSRGHEVEVAVDARRPGDLRARLRALGFAIRDDLALSTKGFPPALLGDARRLADLGRRFDVVHAHFSNDHVAALVGLWRRRERPRAA